MQLDIDINELRPLTDNVIIKIIPIETQTKSGILIAIHPQHSQLVREIYSNRGIIFKKGKETTDTFNIGNKVHFYRHSGTIIKDENDEEYMIIKEDQIYLIEE